MPTLNLKRAQQDLLFEALDALVGDKEDGEAIAWAMDSEKKELAQIRSILKEFFYDNGK